MANSITPNIGLTAPQNFGATNQWGLLLNADFYIIDAIFAPDGTGTSVGLHIGTGNKLQVDTGATLEVNASALKIVDDADNTKVLNINVSNIGAGTTQTLYIPNASGTLALTAATGDIKQTLSSAAQVGWVFCNNTSIGSSTSSATQRANTDTQNLFTFLWGLNMPVVGGRGSTAAADWAANKAICTPDARGAILATADNNGGAAAPATNSLANAGVSGSTLGAKGGQTTEAASVSGSASVSVSGGVSVGVSVSGSLGGGANPSGAEVAAANSGSGASSVAHDHSVTVSGVLNGGGSGSFSGGGGGSISGVTATVTNVPSVLVVATLIAL